MVNMEETRTPDSTGHHVYGSTTIRIEGPRPASDGQGEHLTDVGNAQRVVARHGADFRFCFPWRQFLAWDGRRWLPDETGAVVRMVKETQAEFYRQLAAQVAALGAQGTGRRQIDPELTGALKHALRWEDARRITACLEMVKSEPGVPITPAGLDTDHFLLNVRNGTLDLRTGEVRPHRREDLITKLAPVEYDPNATCPVWLKFLDRIMDGNVDLIDYLQRVAGYSLTGDVSEQCLFFLHGTGANGKSTYLGTIKDLMGDYACQAVSELLLAKGTEAHPTERADLFGRRFVATIEIDEGKRMAEALMKQLTGGDTLKARRLYQDLFEIRPTWKLFLAANHKPNIQGSDYAVWRRIKLVPFAVTIGDDEKDKDLPQKLRAEWPGILAWMVRGCLAWQRDGLGEPEEVKVATDAYQAEQDTVAGFIRECCWVHPDVKARAGDLLEAYQKWSGDKHMTQKAFSQRLRDKAFEGKRGSGGYVFYRGISLAVKDGEGF